VFRLCSDSSSYALCTISCCCQVWPQQPLNYSVYPKKEPTVWHVANSFHRCDRKTTNNSTEKATSPLLKHQRTTTTTTTDTTKLKQTEKGGPIDGHCGLA
jgi:hypothetical protein